MTTSRKEELAQKRRYWRQHLDDWQKSGLTQVAYCRQHELCRHRFQYWKKKFYPKEPPAFIELQFPSGPEGKYGHQPLCLMLGSGYQIAVERDFDPVALKQLIGVLRQI